MSAAHVSTPAAASLGPIELSVIIGALWIVSQVTWPQLLQVRQRAEQGEAKTILQTAATAARAHFLTHGTYRCGDCDARVPAAASYTYSINPDASAASQAAGGPCAQLPEATAAVQSSQAFVATAVRPLGTRWCELWRIEASAGLRRQLLARPN